MLPHIPSIFWHSYPNCVKIAVITDNKGLAEKKTIVLDYIFLPMPGKFGYTKLTNEKVKQASTRMEA
jgi:hypothetical protein